jgi:transposase
MAEKLYRAWPRDQVLLLPPALQRWLPEDHLVHFVLDVVDGLDLRAIERVIHSRDQRGERPWHPKMMVALLFHGLCIGVRSSRRLERATYEDVAFRLLAADTHPDHSSISLFRKKHLAALSALFLEILQLCQEAGMVKLGRVALDGTKMKANASKHEATSHARMREKEAELKEEIARMLAEAEAKAAREAELAERERAKQPPEDPPPPPELPPRRRSMNRSR